MARKYKKHFVLFNNGGIISSATPKDWARANQNIFDDFDFSNSNNTPAVDFIERKLIQLGFSGINNNEVVIFYKYNSL
jgi:hypothetical protein